MGSEQRGGRARSVLVLGAVVAASRWFFPAQPQTASQIRGSAVADDQEVEEERLAA